MRIGILGSGLMGGKLGTTFARAGHEVVFSYARSEDKLKKLAREALFGVGAAALLLLFIGIHNAWDAVAYYVFVSMRKAKD